MKKKIPTLLACDIVLALLIFTKVRVKNLILSDIASDAYLSSGLSNNNWVAIIVMAAAAVVMGVIMMSPTNNISCLIADIVIIGIPGIVISCWWKILYLTGWGYFCSYQEMMAYIGALMVGTCVAKVFMYLMKSRT